MWTSRYESWYLKFIFYHLDRQQYHQATPSCPIMSLWPWKSADMNFDQLAGPEPSKLVGQHDSTCPLICMDKMMLSQHNYKTTIKAEIQLSSYYTTSTFVFLLTMRSSRMLKRVEKVALIVKCYRGGGMYTYNISMLNNFTNMHNMMCFSIRKQVLKWTIFCVKTSFQIIVLPSISNC